MRMRSPEFSSSVRLTDCLVLCDEAEEARLTGDVLTDRCALADFDTVCADPDTDFSAVTLVEWHGDRIAARFKALAAQERYQSIGLLVPRTLEGLFEMLERQAAFASWSLREFACDAHWLHVRFTPAIDADPDATPVLQALRLALAPEPTPVPSPGRASVEMLEKYLALLEFAEEAQIVAATPSDAGQSAGQDRDSKSRLDELAEVRRQAIATRTALDALQRKYDALAGSTLGKATLRYWERNRKGGR